MYPTMIYIHGGIFRFGTSHGCDCCALSISGEVIVVTINYRLNVFGVLSTSGPNSLGNIGLMDMQMAIRWVRNNIHAFGGDVNRITVFDESLGAAGVIYQTLYQGKACFREQLHKVEVHQCRIHSHRNLAHIT